VKTYGSFELLVDFQTDGGGQQRHKDFRHGRTPQNPGGRAKGLEYQLLDDDRHPTRWQKLGIYGNRTLASLYDLLPATNKTVFPIGQWNHARIVVRGKTC